MKVLVVAHVFYTAIWLDLRACIDVIRATGECRLIVTHSSNGEDWGQWQQQNCPEAELRLSDNYGYDIGPFIQVLNSVELAEYDYVVKLHTKRTLAKSVKLPLANVAGGEWRQLLLRFCSTEEHWKSSLECLNHSRVGMVADARVIFSMIEDPAQFPRQGVDAAARQAGLPWCDDYHFVGGSMFAVKASLLKPLQHKFQATQFVSQNDHSVSFAHAVERLFGYAVEAQGMAVADFMGRGKGFRRLCRFRKFLYNEYWSEDHRFLQVFGVRFLCLQRKNKEKNNV